MRDKRGVSGQKKERLIVAAFLAMAIISASFLTKEALGKTKKTGGYSINLSSLREKLKNISFRPEENTKNSLPTSLPTRDAPFSEPSPTPTKTPTKTIKKAKRQKLPANNPPASFPTTAPGQPGSQEWQEEFDRQWKEMGQKIEEKNRQVRQAQEEFCRQNPNLCQ